MKLKYIQRLLLPLCLLPFFLMAQTQAPKWVIPPLVLDFSGSSITSTNLPFTPANYTGANAAFDPSGNLLFYVVDDSIYTNTGSTLIGIKTVDTSSPIGARNHLITRIPGTCNEYYVIYHDPKVFSGDSELYYTKLIATTSSVSVVPNEHDIQFGTGNFEANGFAVSKMFPDKTRFLYNTSSGKTQKYIISNSGISFHSSTFAFAGRVNELDLSPDGTKLAFVTPITEAVSIMDLDVNGNFLPNTIQHYIVPGISAIDGVEFSANSDKIVISGGYSFDNNPGIHVLDISGSTISSVYISGSSAFDGSQVELGYDGKMYFANNSNLASLDLNGNVLNANEFTLTNIGHSYDCFVLPHQIDGQDYTLPSDFDLWVTDGGGDIGNEPDVESGHVWLGDVWNCQNSPTCSVSNLENPEFKFMTPNYARVTIQNIGCSTSQPADLHIYWTRARSGELWDEHWLDPQVEPSNVINGCPGGGEITADASGNPVPMTVPPIPAGGSITLSHAWWPQDPACYPSTIPGTNDNKGNPMVCLLARVVSQADPINGEQMGIIKNNIVASNNVATRNLSLVNLNPHTLIGLGWSFNLWNHQTFTQLMNLQMQLMSPGSNGGSGGIDPPPITDIGNLQITLSEDFWNAWVDGGMQGDGVEVMSEGVLLVTNPDIVKLYNVEVPPGAGFPVSIAASVPEDYQFDQFFEYEYLMTHFTDSEPTGNSGGTYIIQIDPACNFEMPSEALVAPGECTMIGPFSDCVDCEFIWSPTDGLENPYAPRTPACVEEETTYTLTIISSDGCAYDQSVTVYPVLEAGNAPIAAESPASLLDQFWLFPNPSSGASTVSFTLNEPMLVKVSLYNSLGMLIDVPQAESWFVNGKHQIRIESGNLPGGTYYCRLQLGQEVISKALIIK